MPPPPADSGKEQQLLRHARREGLLIMAVWAASLLWSCLVAYFYGYERPAGAIGLIFGMPDWVFWGIALPWLINLTFTIWYCFYFMADDDLGRDPDEDASHG